MLTQHSSDYEATQLGRIQIAETAMCNGNDPILRFAPLSNSLRVVNGKGKGGKAVSRQKDRCCKLSR